MALDIILLVALFIWAVFGYRKGLITQIFTLAGIILTILGAGALADVVESVIVKEIGLNITHTARVFLVAASAALIYILCFIVGRFVHNTLVKGIPLAEKTNHVLGTILGIVECTLVVYFFLCVVHVAENKLEAYSPETHKFFTESRVYQAATQNNLIENFDFFSRWKQSTQVDIKMEASPDEKKPEKLSEKKPEKQDGKALDKQNVKKTTNQDVKKPEQADAAQDKAIKRKTSKNN